MSNKLTFGYNQGLPPDVKAAFGARCIVTQDGHVDFPPGRTSVFGDEPELSTFLAKLDAALPLPALRKKISDLLVTKAIDTRTAGDTVLFDDGETVVVANSNASAGYLYLAAFPKS